jgi:predicted ATPase
VPAVHHHVHPLLDDAEVVRVDRDLAMPVHLVDALARVGIDLVHNHVGVQEQAAVRNRSGAAGELQRRHAHVALPDPRLIV